MTARDRARALEIIHDAVALDLGVLDIRQVVAAAALLIVDAIEDIGAREPLALDALKPKPPENVS